jgi:hypothetical protein
MKLFFTAYSIADVGTVTYTAETSKIKFKMQAA